MVEELLVGTLIIYDFVFKIQYSILATCKSDYEALFLPVRSGCEACLRAGLA